MAEYALRPYAPGDRADCGALWELAFGDPAALAEEFLALFGGAPGFGRVAERNGRVAAAAYAVPGLTVSRPGYPDLPARYLYAVATHPDHRDRGLAADICRTLRDDCFARGELLLTKPADTGLYGWYAEKIGAVPALPCDTRTVTTPCPGEVRPLSAAEYAARREALLSGTAHVRLPEALFVWEHLLHAHYGGGFFAVGDSVADAFFDGQRAEIAELLSPAPEQAAGALLRHFGAPAAEVTLPGSAAPYVSCAGAEGVPQGLDAV